MFFMILLFGFGLVQMTYLKPAGCSPAQDHAFGYPTCHSNQDLTEQWILLCL